MKRNFEINDSPASSTPPLPPAKRRRQNIDSDGLSSEASYRSHMPSDSPSNPFGRFKPRIPQSLPESSPDSHLVLRFQLVSQSHNVYRIAAVPAEYTFWHLSRVVQFLFGWKDSRFERSPHNRHEKIERKCVHVFTVQKDVSMSLQANRQGVIKNGRTVARVLGKVDSAKLKSSKDVEEEVQWEREECYTLQHVWKRGNEVTRGALYDRDVYAHKKEVVHITLCNGVLLASFKRSQLEVPDEYHNTPHVLQGAGLPDDEEDEELQLDLLQWNEAGAFENFLRKMGDEGLDEDDSDDDEESEEYKKRLEKEKAKVKRRMSAPLPKKLPLDEEFEEDEVPTLKPIIAAVKPKPGIVHPERVKVRQKRDIISIPKRLIVDEESERKTQELLRKHSRLGIEDEI